MLGSLHLAVFWEDGPTVRPTPGGVAAEAGLPPGRLLAVDGRPIPDDATLAEIAARLRGPVGEPVRLTVQPDTGPTVTVPVARTLEEPPVWREAPLSRIQSYFIDEGVYAVRSLFFLACGLILLVMRPRSLVALLGATAFLGSSLELFGPVRGGAGGAVLAGLLWPMEWLPNTFLFAFFAVFPDGRVRPWWAWAFVLFAGAEVLSAPGLLGAEWLDRAVLIVGFGTMAAALAVRYRRHSTPDQRQQTKWAVLGLAGSATLTALLVATVLALGSWDDMAAAGLAWLVPIVVVLGSVMDAPLAAGVLLSLLRYRLWDVESVWSRSAAYGALTVVLTAVAAALTAVGQTAFGAGGPLALGLGTAAAAVLFVPLQGRLTAWAEGLFLRDLTDLKRRLPDLVGHLRETESVGGIAEAVVRRVAPTVHAAEAALLVPGDDGGWTVAAVEGADPASVADWAEAAGLSSPPVLTPRRRQPWRRQVWQVSADGAFPLRVALTSERAGGEVAVEGWLVLGPRPDGSGYGPDDLEAVAEVAGPVGRALRVVRVREAREAARESALAAALRQLRDDLGVSPRGAAVT